MMEISRRKQFTTLSFLILMSTLLSLSPPVLPDTSNKTHDVENETKVGVILDMGSYSGKTIDLCIGLAISDFYALNSVYKTRMVPYPIDSKGEASRALSAVHHLLNNVKVQAIIVTESSLEGKLMALLSDKAKVPFFSFTKSPSSKEFYPYLFQIKMDETTTLKAAAALVESFKWMHVIVVYEDTDYGRETLPSLVKYFHEKNIVITYSSAISPSYNDDQISKELHKVISIGTTILILHMPTSQASGLLLNAKKLRMVNEKYTWIITDKAIDLLPSMHSDAIASMEGALSFKPNIRASSELLNFTYRLRREYESRYPSSEAREMNVLSMWAYDAVFALAESVERARNKTFVDLKQGSELANDHGVSLTSAVLVNEISQIKFKGLSGDFELINGKLVSKELEVVKMRGPGETRVGRWTLTDGIKKDTQYTSNSADQYTNSGLKDTICPRRSTTTSTYGKKLRIAVPVKSTFKEFLNVEKDTITNNWTFRGYCIDLFIAVKPSGVEYEFIPFVGSDGDTSGSYEELLQQISQQMYDGAVADITILANRSQWVDFTVTYTDLGVGKIARINDNKDMWIVFKPLGLDWLSFAASFLIMGFLVWLFEHPTNEMFQGSAAQQIGTVLTFAFSTLFFADQRAKLTSNWARFLVIVWSFIVLLLIACYTAILSSLLTVQQFKLTGNNIGYHTGSFVERVIVNNMNYSDYRLQPYQSAKDFADALSRGGKNGGVDVIVDEIPYLKVFLAQYPVGYAMVSSNTSTSGFGFAFQKGSPLVHDVSREIAKLREDGTLVMLERKWFGDASSSLVSPESAANEPKILEFGDLGGLVCIGATVFGLALLRYIYTFFQKPYRLYNCLVVFIIGGRLATLMNCLYPRRNPN